MSVTRSSEENDPPAGAAAGGRIERFLIIAGLCGLVVAQPILDLLGDSPTTFQFNNIPPAGIVLFAVGVVVLPPLVLWLAGEGVFGLNRRAGRVAHASTVAGLCGLFAVLLTKSLTTGVVANSGAGLAGVAVGAWASTQAATFVTWARFLSAANPVFLGLFVFLAPVSDTIWAGTQNAIEVPAELETSPSSVVMLVLDELPTQSLLTEDEAIDGVRFPNLASFAEEATFYRHFSTVSPFTQSAVPALLDGLDPFGGPTWTDHPQSLFSLLGGTHHLIVSETITNLCGLAGCGVRPLAPPPPDGSDPSPAEVPDVDTGPQWGRLLDTTVDIWTDRVRPGSGETSRSFDDYAEDIIPTTPRSDPVPDPSADRNGGLDEAGIALERFLATQVVGQPKRHQLFVDALQPTDVPFLGFLHLILPHQPWTLREDGTPYAIAGDRTNFENDNDHDWPVAVSRQRHLLQAEYADRLLGDVIGRLKEIGEYDDTIIVVVGDHGVAFEPGEPSRRVTDANLEQIAYSPLVIKAAGQVTAHVDDSNLNSTDVTPTIAALLGITLPWETDGRPVGSAAINARGNRKYVHSFTDAFDYEFLGIVEYDDGAAYGDLLTGLGPFISADEDRIAGLYREVEGGELIGESPDSVFGEIGGSVTVTALAQLQQPDLSSPVLGEIAGRVPDAATGSTVLVALNGRIAGVSPLYPRNGEDNHFVVLLPRGALHDEENTVRVALRDPDGPVTELAMFHP